MISCRLFRERAGLVSEIPGSETLAGWFRGAGAQHCWTAGVFQGNPDRGTKNSVGNLRAGLNRSKLL